VAFLVRSDFNYDFHVTMDAAPGGAWSTTTRTPRISSRRGKLHTDQGEFAGLSVFLRDGDAVFSYVLDLSAGSLIFLLILTTS